MHRNLQGLEGIVDKGWNYISVHELVELHPRQCRSTLPKTRAENEHLAGRQFSLYSFDLYKHTLHAKTRHRAQRNDNQPSLGKPPAYVD